MEIDNHKLMNMKIAKIYIIKRKIGGGSFGSIYEARN
jgi:hypothetical protein